ncbi:hypothetical protein [Granulosicoccus antarcticus]|uniref:Solute-binding protein family 3/N-terminal domain-containing protein n=1 Tax=Granulosicoccus antarcticus IMCC3135 TaxID=1192854 RepID=A0A2Z2NNB2_9GAMM|nr:hypothetical protein [Granulosicoccus antarcticus]ASJ72886.1 hypothetical protein IMCC3135_14005 [Granulosicoccus antarcticus IMCC3135]
MFKKSFAATAMIFALATPALAQQDLHAALTAAMGEAIEDARYVDVTTKYGMPAPDLSDPTLVNSEDYPYPEVMPGTLLAHVLDTHKLSLGWIPVGAPWAIPGENPSQPIGFSVDYFDIIQEKLNAHYNTDIDLEWVSFTESAGNNDMYLWLSTSDDVDCTAEDRVVDGCYDVIGGAYAINERRSGLTDITPSYYPFNMAAIRTNVPLPEGVAPIRNADDIRAAMADPTINIAIAGLPETGEDSILTAFNIAMGSTFTHIDRTPGSNVLEYAQNSEDAHFVLGSNVRMASTRMKYPEFCIKCELFENFSAFRGIGFATALID